MPKTQAELDAAVIEAAEREVRDTGHDANCKCGWDLCEEVRARREAMRPHKAAVLLHFFRRGFSHEIDAARAMKEWNDVPKGFKEDARRCLAAVAAAPDEPQEPRDGE